MIAMDSASPWQQDHHIKEHSRQDELLVDVCDPRSLTDMATTQPLPAILNASMPTQQEHHPSVVLCDALCNVGTLMRAFLRSAG